MGLFDSFWSTTSSSNPLQAPITSREGLATEGASSSPASTQADPAAACPVDHKTRQAWLDQARKSQDGTPSTRTIPPISSLPANEACDSSQMDQSTRSPPPQTKVPSTLGTHRVISSIPRASSSPADPAGATSPVAKASSASHGAPSNNEIESGSSTSGHWIYPSERMFFDAMKRKNYDPSAQDMKSIVPIHNAVNERAWTEILKWEKAYATQSSPCGGPKLVSFAGDSQKLTPRARWNSLLGYQAPFDRHDWVVDRCGTKVEYVIDFYSGKDEGLPGKSLSFYLDVRPKLNSWEGWKMRALRGVGMG